MAKIHVVSAFTVICLALVQTGYLTSGAPSSREAKQEESCHLRELDLCLASVAVFTQSVHNHPVTNSELTKQCKVLVETESCLANFTNRCFTDMQSEMFDLLADGGLATIRDLCKPSSKTRETYLKHADCIQKQHNEQKVCMRNFQVSLEKAVDIAWQDRLKLGCCSFNKLHACVRDVIEPKCGSEAYEMSSKLFHASFSRLPSITCAKYEHNSKTCAALLPPAGSVPKGAKSHSVLSKLFSTYTQ